MPIPMAIGTVWKLTTICRLGSQYSQNVLHYVVLAQAGVGMDDELGVNKFDVLWHDKLVPLMSNEAFYEGVKMQKVHPVSSQAVSSVANIDIGEVAGGSLPPQTCGLLKKFTATGGRSGRGRMYLPFPAKADSTAAGIPTEDYISRANSAGILLSNNVVLTDGANTVTLSCHLAKPPYGAVNTLDITTASCRSHWATQRRRSFVNSGDARPF